MSSTASSTSSAGPSATPTTTGSAQPSAADPRPRVRNKRLVDFTDDPTLPSGGTIYDVGKSDTGLAVTDGVLTHGAPRSDDATGYLETKLGADVVKIGFAVRFAASGSEGGAGAAVTAWQTSVEQARRGGGGLPKSGMRLEVGPASWQLLVVDGESSAIGSGTYVSADAAAARRFVVTRSAAEVWVTDPNGQSTHVEDPRVKQLAGPWASWELSEKTTGAAPASITKVWAG